jgi:hypothetical protein
MNPWIAAIWWIMLVAVVLVVVPMVVALLFRAVTAARNIERYTAEALAGGVGIAQNTANVAALQQTIGVATQLLAGAESIERSTATIGTALGAPERANGHTDWEEADAWKPS